MAYDIVKPDLPGHVASNVDAVPSDLAVQQSTIILKAARA
jgi:hypothetical protein